MGDRGGGWGGGGHVTAQEKRALGPEGAAGSGRTEAGRGGGAGRGDRPRRAGGGRDGGRGTEGRVHGGREAGAKFPAAYP